MPLQVGSKAPDFQLKSKQPSGLEDKKLSSNYGKTNTLVLFVPAAFTPVCTSTFCNFSKPEFQSYKSAEIWGISSDTPFTQEAWAKNAGIEITLLSDFDKRVAKQYDMYLEDFRGMGSCTGRGAYIVDKDGIIQYAEKTPIDQQPNWNEIKKKLDELASKAA